MSIINVKYLEVHFQFKPLSVFTHGLYLLLDVLVNVPHVALLYRKISVVDLDSNFPVRFAIHPPYTLVHCSKVTIAWIS